MGKLILYGIDGSAPVRSVLLTLKALNVPFEYKVVNLMNKEHLTPEFLKINPQHTLPTLDDDGFYLWDSHAINAYLVGKYAKSDALYPKDLQQRAVIDQRLHYDSSVIGTTVRSIVYPLFFKNETVIPKERIDAVAEIYNTVENYLKNQDYVAGSKLTIADFHLIAIIATVEIFLKIDSAKYPKIASWMQRMKQLPYYEEANGGGLKQFIAMANTKKFTIG